MRSKYLFTTRERSRAIVATPEDLAWQLGAGKATLIVEPVPLFDRAVSAALDTLAAQKPHGRYRGRRLNGADATRKKSEPQGSLFSCSGDALAKRQIGVQNATAFGPIPSGAHPRLSIARRTDRLIVYR